MEQNKRVKNWLELAKRDRAFAEEIYLETEKLFKWLKNQIK